MSIMEIIKKLACGICGCNKEFEAEAIRLRVRIAELEAQFTYPEPPATQGTITGDELRALLQGAGFNSIHIGDHDYSLMSCDDCRRFLTWFDDTVRYTLDDYDCEDKAWAMRSEALKWMKGVFQFGYVWAGGEDPNYQFPNHGFCFLVDSNRDIYYCDELCVAAPNDDLEPFYPIDCELTIS